MSQVVIPFLAHLFRHHVQIPFDLQNSITSVDIFSAIENIVPSPIYIASTIHAKPS